jgi:imidazole glycerol phosphate synthase subunit HisF
LIASGGCSGYEDMLRAFQAGADACAAGALFAFTDATPRGAAQFLKNQGMEVRL